MLRAGASLNEPPIRTTIIGPQLSGDLFCSCHLTEQQSVIHMHALRKFFPYVTWSPWTYVSSPPRPEGVRWVFPPALGILHLVYATISPLIVASLVRYTLLHFHLSRMAVHHHLLHHLHYHHLHLLLLVQSFILNLILGSLTNPFLHRPFPLLLDWFNRLSDHLMFLFCSTAEFICIWYVC